MRAQPPAPVLTRPCPKKADWAGAEICFQSSGRTSCEDWICRRPWACRQGVLWESVVNTRGQPVSRTAMHAFYCLCSFSSGQYLWCSKTQRWANTDLWLSFEGRVGKMRSAKHSVRKYVVLAKIHLTTLEMELLTFITGMRHVTVERLDFVSQGSLPGLRETKFVWIEFSDIDITLYTSFMFCKT